MDNVRISITEAPDEITVNAFGSDLLTYVPEDEDNKVSAFQGTPDDTHYPSEKLIKDSLDTKSDSTHTHTSFGTIANYTEFESDGTIHMVGDATVYDDISLSGLSFSSGGSVAPDIVDFVSANLKAYGFDGGTITERLYVTTEMKHSYLEGSDIELHVHWTPSTANTGNVRWQLYYSWQKTDGTYTTPTLLSVTSAARGAAWQNTYASYGSISGTGMTIHSQLVFQLFRDPTDTLDTYSDDAVLIALGVHFQKDTVGSRQQAVK